MTTAKASSAAAGAADDDKDKDAGGPAKVAEHTGSDLAALRAELDAMRDQLAAQQAALAAQAGQVPAPVEPSEPQDPTHVLTLGCGHSVELPNTIGTHAYCDEHGVTVPVTGVYPLAA